MSKIKKIKVAITGNIGSGKSTFSKFLEDEGFPVIYADDISKDILVNDSNIRNAVIKEFGAESFQGNKINHKYIADIIFSSTKQLKKINSILHPPVQKKIKEITEKYFKTNDLVFVETALIYESKIENQFDYVVLITADENLRKMRSTSTQNISEENFIKRNNNQIKQEIKLKKADFVFSNEDSKVDLINKAKLLIKLLEPLHQ